MSAHLNPDSSFAFDFIPIDGSGEVRLEDSSGRELFTSQVPMFDLASDEPLPDIPEESRPSSLPKPATPPRGESTAASSGQAGPGGLWIEGDVLMCGCPDCRAPMTIRSWLMIADCWNCGISIELSEEQEREAMRLMEEQQRRHEKRVASPRPKPQQPTPGSPPAAATKPEKPRPQTSPMPEKQRPANPPGQPTRESTGRKQEPTPAARPKPTEPQRRPQPRPTPPPPKTGKTSTPDAPPTQPKWQTHPAHPGGRRRHPGVPLTGARARIRQMANTGTTGVVVRDWFKDTPAWLISLVIHMALLMLLAIFTLPYEVDEDLITLSATVSADVKEGGTKVQIDPKDEIKFDLPVPPKTNLDNPNVREAMVRADQDARELRVDPNTIDPQMPELNAVKSKITQHGSPSAALAARDPRVRVEMVKAEGGTTLTEAAVARGLRWLAQQQQPDGRWKLDGGIRSDAAGTSLALLPFLGAGQTHLVGRYKNEVSKGLRWMIQHQKPDGDMRAGSSGNSGMYAQGQAAIVLCEAFWISGDEELRVPAQKAIDFIIAAQHHAGGWRYRPGEAGDTSVVGWQLMALQSAKAANLNVHRPGEDPDGVPSVLELSGQFLDTVSSHDGARYAYMRGRPATETMTAEALLCRMYLGWKKDEPGLMQGTRWLAENHLPRAESPNIYYWYYGTQMFHHIGGPEWERWNSRMRDILVSSQLKSGNAAGSWDPRGDHASAGGRIYMTALAVCTLEVYYRHLPIFRQIDLD